MLSFSRSHRHVMAPFSHKRAHILKTEPAPSARLCLQSKIRGHFIPAEFAVWSKGSV